MENNKSKLNKLSNQLKDNINVVINKELNDIAPNILGKDTENGVMPEGIFVEYFLPYFKAINKPENKDSTMLAKWLEVSGGIYNGVDLVDQEGNVVKTVPPICKRNVVNMAKLSEAKTNFNNIVASYKKDQEYLDTVANNNLAKKINNLPKFVNPATKDDDISKKWKDVIDYYDKQTKAKDEEEKKQEDNVPKRVKEDLGLDYND